MAMNEYEATVKTTEIIENAKNENILNIGGVAALIVFIISIFIYSYGNAYDIEMAKAGLEQCKLPDESVTRQVWVKSCKEYLISAKNYKTDKR